MCWVDLLRCLGDPPGINYGWMSGLKDWLIVVYANKVANKIVSFIYLCILMHISFAALQKSATDDTIAHLPD